MSRSATSRLIARESAKPSIFGIRMSLMITSGDVRIASSSAVVPSSASWTMQPVVRRRSARNQVTPGSSSATTTRRPSSVTSAAAPRTAADAIGAAANRGWKASAIVPSGPPPAKRTAPPVRVETTSRTRAIAPQIAAMTSVPSPSATRLLRELMSTAPTMARRTSSARRSPSCSIVGSPSDMRIVRPSR